MFIPKTWNCLIRTNFTTILYLRTKNYFTLILLISMEFTISKIGQIYKVFYKMGTHSVLFISLYWCIVEDLLVSEVKIILIRNFSNLFIEKNGFS